MPRDDSTPPPTGSSAGSSVANPRRTRLLHRTLAGSGSGPSPSRPNG